MTADCAFCEIIAGEAPAHVVYRGRQTTAFLDLHPAGEGHTLVVPNEHLSGLTDMDGETTAAVFATARDVAGALERAFDADGISLFQSSGAAAGQDVFHVHVHVIPRFEADDIRFAPPRDRLTDDWGRRVVEKIERELENG